MLQNASNYENVMIVHLLVSTAKNRLKQGEKLSVSNPGRLALSSHLLGTSRIAPRECLSRSRSRSPVNEGVSRDITRPMLLTSTCS